MAVSCCNLFSAALSQEHRVDKLIMPLQIFNFTDEDVEFVHARTDPMNHILPSMHLSIPAKHMTVARISCLFGLLLIPRLRGMLNIELSQDLKERYLALKGRGGHAYIRIDPISRLDPLYGEKEFKVTSYLQLRDEHYEVDRYAVNAMPLATAEQIRDEIVDKCIDYLPEKEGSYILGKPKYLRRSAG